MTQKELLYIEDAIGHETNTIAILDESINMVEDEELKKFLKAEHKKHTNTKEKLLKFMEDKKDE